MTVRDIWTDIEPLNAAAAERLGYPTKRPGKILKRIIEASSNSGGIVLVPFCGCGTAVVAAEKLDHRWAGIDISPIAVGIIQDKRLKPLGIQADTYGIPFALKRGRETCGRSAVRLRAIGRHPGTRPCPERAAERRWWT